MNTLAALAVLATLVVPVGAQDASSTMGSGCMMQQLTALCPDAKPGTPAFGACAKQHTGDAMAACSKSASDAGAAAAKKSAPASPCADDVQKYCPGKWPGTPEFGACMKSHESDLTPTCAAYAKKRAAQGSKSGDMTCVDDAKKYCPGLTVMDHEKFTACMSKNYDSLSPACAAKFKGLKSASGKHDECMTALKTLCPDLQPGDNGGMMQCMMAHRADMPASCHQHGKH